MTHFVRLFDGFAETGILKRMIEAAMKVFNQLMDPKQKHKFPISNLWDVGNRVEKDINHWFNMHVVFQARRTWYKRYFGRISATGEPISVPIGARPGRGLPN